MQNNIISFNAYYNERKKISPEEYNELRKDELASNFLADEKWRLEYVKK